MQRGGSYSKDGSVMSEITRMLNAIDAGDPSAAGQLLPLVYDELRQLAAWHLAQEQPGQTLQPTALVHEAYLRLIGGGGTDAWNGPGHFFAAAAEAMRRILVENARRRNREKHGKGRQRVDFDEACLAATAPDEYLESLDEALARFEAIDPLAANLVKLRFFAGLNMPEAAHMLGLTLRTAERNWAFARSWIHRALAE
jgi:RNA polymerase sigma factor (TIGR02999 family)